MASPNVIFPGGSVTTARTAKTRDHDNTIGIDGQKIGQLLFIESFSYFGCIASDPNIIILLCSLFALPISASPQPQPEPVRAVQVLVVLLLPQQLEASLRPRNVYKSLISDLQVFTELYVMGYSI